MTYMETIRKANVITRRGATGHEDVSFQMARLGSEVWDEYAKKLGTIKETQNKPVRYYPDEDDHSYTEEGHLKALQKFHNKLTQKDIITLLAIHTRATTNTSTLVSFLQVGHGGIRLLKGSHSSHETEWTDEKNKRRCELVDKEIDGLLSPDEQIELEELQAEMLAYRRKVAPLPLHELREIHRQLSRSAHDLAE
jgi:hypothetical protein